MDITLLGIPLAILLPVIAIAVCGLFLGVRGAIVAAGVSAGLVLVAQAIHHI